MGLPWWSSGWDSELPMQGAWVRSLVRELDPTCRNWGSRTWQRRSCVPHLGPGVVKEINIKKEKKSLEPQKMKALWASLDLEKAQWQQSTVFQYLSASELLLLQKLSLKLQNILL